MKEVFPGETIKELEEAGQERRKNWTNMQILGSLAYFKRKSLDSKLHLKMFWLETMELGFYILSQKLVIV